MIHVSLHEQEQEHIAISLVLQGDDLVRNFCKAAHKQDQHALKNLQKIVYTVSEKLEFHFTKNAYLEQATICKMRKGTCASVTWKKGMNLSDMENSAFHLLCVQQNEKAFEELEYMVQTGMKRQDHVQVQSIVNTSSAKPRTGYAYDDRMQLHAEKNHPECPERLSSIYEWMKKFQLDTKCQAIPCVEASKEQLQMVHNSHYVQTVFKLLTTNAKKNPNTKAQEALFNQHAAHFKDSLFFNEYTKQACLLAAGGAIQLTRAVLQNKLDNGFCISRPPGHHSGIGYAKGFCYFNNVAIAAKTATEEFGLQRVLIFDFDIHHGNGTEEIFFDNDKVLYMSTHGMAYPGTGNPYDVGKDKAKGKTVNIPFPGVFHDSDMLYAFHQVILPIAKQFKPELILISAGYDAVDGDWMGENGTRNITHLTALELSTEIYGYMTYELKQVCNKLVMALEGGYNHRQTAVCVCDALHILLGSEPKPLPESEPIRFKGIVDHVANIQKEYWSL